MTRITVDDRLIEEARRIGKHRTKREAATVALEQYIRRRRQLAILELAGIIEFDSGYHYKRARGRWPKCSGNDSASRSRTFR